MSQLREGSLFTGTNALGMACAEVLGSVPAWFSEHEPPTEKTPRPRQGAARLLAHHYPHVTNLGDITAVDWTTVEPVQLLTGGFPCTDVSAAGKRAGLKPGTRSGLWNQMAYAISILRPALVFIENVRGLASAEAHSDLEPCPLCLGDGPDEPVLRALGAVLGDLAELGYDAVWCGLRAADVGAPHGRFRIFILATDTRGEALPRWTGSGAGEQAGLGWARPGDSGAPPADTDGEGREGTEPARGRDLPARCAAADPNGGRRGRHTGGTRRQAVERAAPDGDRAGSTPDADADGSRRRADEPHDGARQPDLARRNSATTDADRDGLEIVERLEPGLGPRHDADRRSPINWGDYEPAVRRWETILGPKGGTVLNPALTEWMMGLPDGWITTVPGLSRNDQLKLAGNGVVPQQAAAALRYLLARLNDTATRAA